MIKKLLCVTALLVGCLVGAQAAPVLRVTPSLTNATVGSSFSVDIEISGVSDLFGWQLDLNFGPVGLLNAMPATEGSFLGAPTSFFDGGTVDNSGGTVTTMFNALAGAAGVSGDGILASISFQAMAVGSATLGLMNVQLVDSNLDDIFFSWPEDAFSAVVNITGGGGTEVPEPSTLALLGLALACVLLNRRQAKSSPVNSHY